MQRDCNRRSDAPQDADTAVKNGVCVLSGFGIRVTVQGKHLVCNDGFADERREIRLTRATSGLKRLVITGHTGIITLDSLRWLSRLGAGIAVIDADGTLLIAAVPLGADYPHLRRAQALARDSSSGIAIVKALLQAKIAGQADVLKSFGFDDAPALTLQSKMLADTSDYDSMRCTEGQAAAIYWRHWENVAVSFTSRDAAQVPAHWVAFGCRTSPISGGPRRAANPANALLNYLYTMLETETVIACHTVGLDPGIGIMHSDQPSRNSLALDIMEAARPEVDRWLLQFLSRQVFRKHDFCEEENSGCTRISYEVRKMLAETSPLWANAVAPWAEYVAKCLNNTNAKLPTPLTERNRSRGRDGIRKKASIPARIRVETKPVCRKCGSEVPHKDRLFCDTCLPERRNDQLPLMLVSGVSALKEARANGKDPAHGGKAAAKRSSSQKRRSQARLDWEKRGLSIEEEQRRFIEKIQPKLASVPLSAIMNATGLSIRYCSLIKSGAYVPHPVHYAALAGLVADAGE